MKVRWFVLGVVAAVACALPATVQAQYFFDDFDGYVTGSSIAGQGGWETWGGNPSANATVVNSQAYSTPNSLAVQGDADIVHQFAGLTTGTWYAKVQTYVPSSQTGDVYFIILNRFDGSCTSAGACNWSVQVRMTATDGQVVNEGGSGIPGTGSTALLTDQWVEMLVEINLSANQYTIWYNNILLDILPWTTTGDINIAAFDLFSDGSSESYMDNVWLDTSIPVELQSFDIE